MKCASRFRSENLPPPDILARDITENLQAALEQFNTIQEDLEEKQEIHQA